MRYSRVRLLLAAHLAYNIRQRHYIIFCQCERFYFAELPLHFYVWYHLAQLLEITTTREVNRKPVISRLFHSQIKSNIQKNRYVSIDVASRSVESSESLLKRSLSRYSLSLFISRINRSLSGLHYRSPLKLASINNET